MVYLPEDIQNYIFSFLPIVSEEKKRLNSIVLNYNYYLYVNWTIHLKMTL